VLILLLAAAPASLVPTLHGLQAPGPVAAVEPMIVLPPTDRQPPTGSFLLTTVITQTPILAGQWVYALLDPAVALVPPAAVVPEQTTPQALMATNYRLLNESMLAASVVALRLAGYPARVSGEAVEVVAILPESHARGLLQPADRILAVDGVPTGLAAEVIDQVQAHPPSTSVELLIERAGERQLVHVPLLTPAMPGDPPRIGISVQTVGLVADLPIPVQIEPHKILGGPSAGLMFTLALYDRLTPDDLTGGWRIAGTGTMALDGSVGPVGGVAQKVAAAERAGAAYFLVPPGNGAEARRTAGRITVIEVATAEAAITALRRLSPAAR
jgi:PDZ domain-containing protein